MPDDFDSVVADRFKVLDDVPVPDTWTRVQFKVLDHMPVPFNKENATMIDLETPSATDYRQNSSKRVRLAGLLAAAAVVVVVAVLAFRSGNDPEVLTPADTSVTSATELVVRPLKPTIECELELCPWSPELTAEALDLPNTCDSSIGTCSNLAVAPDGTLVGSDPTAGTLTWYEDDPRVVPVAAEPSRRVGLLAIGPHDVAYLEGNDQYVAVAPSGAEITRVPFTSRQPTPVYATPTGLVTGPRSQWTSPNAASPDMPWVDLDGNPITDTRPYPTAKVTDAGIEVRLGEREWLLANEPGIRPVPVEFLPRSDGGVVIVFDTWHFGQHQPANVDEEAPAINLLELSPDGTIERYFVDTPLPPVVLPDGSVIVDHNSQPIRLTPPG